MDIAVDREHAACVNRALDMDIAEVEAHVVRVDLERGAMLLRGGEELVHRGLKTWPAVHDAAGRMADHMDERVRDRLQEAVGRDARLLLERGVRARHHPVEFGEQVVCVVERAVRQDVDLAARPDLHVRMPLARLVDRLDVRAQPRLVETVRLELALRMVGDRDRLEPARERPLDEFVNRHCTI